MIERADEAVLVIDVQNNLCHPDGAFCREMGFDVADFVAAAERAVVLVRAARAAGIPVVQTRAEFQADYADAGVVLREVLDERMQASRALVAGSWETQIVDGLGPAPTDSVIPKNRSSAFYGTQLEPLLRSLGVRRLTICGVSASCCVESTSRDAVERGYAVTVAADATAEHTRERCAVTLRTLAEHFCTVATVDEIVTAWAPAPAPATAPAPAER